jgi:dihydrolipoamide dehydrogenase
MAEARDLIVLGSGPGGYVAAIRASQLGRKVTIIEKESLGGVCLNWGCIPSKALLRSAQLYHDIHRAAEYGFETGAVKMDFPKIITRSRDVASKLSQGVSFLMKKNKVEVVYGTGTIKKGNVVSVTDKDGKNTDYSYKDIIIAVGARPRQVPGFDVDGQLIHTSRTVLEHKEHPKKLLVVGAGAIGIEFAYFFNSLGTEVTVVEMQDQILPVEDAEISKTLETIFTKRGMKIHTSTSVSGVTKSGKTVSAVLKGPKGEEKWQGDKILVAIGVTPNTENIGLESVGIKVDRGFIQVDGFMKTNVPNHYAIGDCTGKQLLAHKASHEALVAAESACGKAKHPMHYDNIAGCTYCQPQVASVGLTEKQVKEKGIKYKVGKMPFSAIGKAIAIGEPEGMCKVIIDEEVGEVLGVHIVHSEATELITEAAIIRSHEGIAASVLDTVHPHPTLSESVAEAMALALGRPINF